MTSGKARTETLNSLLRELRNQAVRTVVFHSAVAARLGITITDLSCLNMLSMDGPSTPGELARRIGITNGGAVTAMVDRLERAGYVRRERDPGDRRRVRVELVAERAAAAVTPLFAGLGAGVAGELDRRDDAELARLLEFVGALNGVLGAAAAALRDGTAPAPPGERAGQ